MGVGVSIRGTVCVLDGNLSERDISERLLAAAVAPCELASLAAVVTPLWHLLSGQVAFASGNSKSPSPVVFCAQPQCKGSTPCIVLFWGVGGGVGSMACG